MTQIPLREAETQLIELARRVEAGESITVTHDGKPLMQLVPVKKKGGINWEGLEAFKNERGIDQFVTYISPDFDDPLPEDFLITPLPPFKNGP
ncbi:prevent-host-death protein [Pararhizobium antarcticum]|uniref:Prevent-host-death protein n=2 Tax=Pararhizobium antarcticum TaxID=1798805 RepID=A0A657LT08_9HYPH|nr:prevent-host-death protein [Pararhizobium antarcticum]